MNTMIKIGSFTSAGAAVNINCGFVPDYVKIINLSATAEDVSIVEWFREAMGDGKYVRHIVIDEDGAGLGLSPIYVATGGCSEINGVVEDPDQWTASTVYAVGDVVRPTTNNGYFYKCSTAGTSHTAEPVTWGTTVAGTTAEGGGAVVWTCYNQGDVPVRRVSRQGFTIPAALQNSSDVCTWMAVRSSDENMTEADY